MFQDELTDYQKHVLRMTKIIAGALIAGSAVFAVVAIAIALGKQPGEPMLAYVAVAFTVADLLAYAIAPRLVTSAQVRQIASGKYPVLNASQQGGIVPPADAKPSDYLLLVFLQKTIIENALIEGVVFLNLVAYLITTLWWSLAIAAALIAIMMVTFPTQSKAGRWVEDQLQLIDLQQ